MGFLDEYVLVTWPDIQDYMILPEYKEVYFGSNNENEAWFVPKYLYNRVSSISEYEYAFYCTYKDGTNHMVKITGNSVKQAEENAKSINPEIEKLSLISRTPISEN